MKPFNLAAAKALQPVQCRDGKRVRNLIFDLNNPRFPVGGVVAFPTHEDWRQWDVDGNYNDSNSDHPLDLVMVTVKTKYTIFAWKKMNCVRNTISLTEDKVEECRKRLLNDGATILQKFTFEVEE